MASLNTSELQFAFIFFAKFNQLNNYGFNRVIVPSTVMEGRDNYTYNGTDLVLDDFFFQFKMSSLLVRAYAREHDTLNVPYFRFSVKNSPTRTSRLGRGQLDFLIDHANRPNNKVLYVAPSFDPNMYTREAGPDFWAHQFYLSQPNAMDNFCAFINIRSIPRTWVTNDDDHVICYEHGANSAAFFSEPKKVETIKNPVQEVNIYQGQLQMFISLEARIKQITASIRSYDETFSVDSNVKSSNISPVRYIQDYLLHNFDLVWLPLIMSVDDFRNQRVIEIKR